jgi:hypothetical protein
MHSIPGSFSVHIGMLKKATPTGSAISRHPKINKNKIDGLYYRTHTVNPEIQRPGVLFFNLSLRTQKLNES